MKRLRRLLTPVLCLLLLLGVPLSAAAEDAPFTVTLQLGTGTIDVRAFADGSESNLYLSLSDLSAALSSTAKQFRIELTRSAQDGDIFTITRGLGAAAPSAAVEGVPSSVSSLDLRRNRLFADGAELKYYTFRFGTELYMSLTDIQLLFDLTVERSDDGSLRLRPDLPFAPDAHDLQASGFLDAVNAVLIGDADTGELLYTLRAETPYPVASLTKLMSYLLLAEDLNAGRYHLTDQVPISERASALSLSADGMIRLRAGGAVPLTELLDAMLLASSNESALALAEYAAGSVEAFLALMNRRAAELGLTSAVFRTVNGLPVYSGSAVPAKLQNIMSAADLFTLCRLLLQRYPALTERTSRQFVQLPTLDYTTANSNPMVFNFPGVNGLKTGNTNRAGYCLACSLPVGFGGETHTVLVIVLGAETPTIRNQATQMLLNYAQRVYTSRGFASGAAGLP